mmetsp:Transcript_28338/g.56612  ORF Transcript_28338/g.56612 Transcript_28338/m.56612 type:complete len:87 (-) Transcript_28338:206-466(-)
MMSRQRKSSPTSTSAEKASGGGGRSAFRSDGALKRSRTGLGELGFLVVVVVVIVDVCAGFGEFRGEELPPLRWPAFFFGAFAVGVE